eukprot:32843_1
MGQCCSSQEPELSTRAGIQMGNALLAKGEEITNETGTKLLDRVETTFDDTMEKMINKKLLEKVDSTFDKAVDVFIDKTVSKAMEQFNSKDEESKYEIKEEEKRSELDPYKEAKLGAEKQLKEWGLPQVLIDKMDEEGWLDEDNWSVLTKGELKRMQFGNGHIELFVNGIQKLEKEKEDGEEKKKVDPNEPSQLLSSWGLPSNLIDKMNEVGWVHPQYWDDLLYKGADTEYELEQLGFKTGHISSFKRKFQAWKEDQDSKATERKVELLRKLQKSHQKESSILKRNIDIENKTNEPVMVRIVGERKYGSFASKSKAQSAAQSKQLQQSRDERNVAKNTTNTQQFANATMDKTKNRGFGVGASVETAGLPFGVGANFNTNKEDEVHSTSNSASHAQTDQTTEQKTNREHNIASASSAQDAESNVSKHEWEKVSVGFTQIVPNQIIVFPVQISDPNAVVYMTIYVPSTAANVCENVQIDSNYIRIEKVQIPNQGERIKWQHMIKQPKRSRFATKQKHESKHLIDGDKLCKYMKQCNVSDTKIEFIQQSLSDCKYDVNKDDDTKALIEHICTAASIHQAMYPKQRQNHDDVKEIAKRFVDNTRQLVHLQSETHKHYNEKKKSQNFHDLDSDDEELQKVSKFFDVDGYSLLQKWKLEQFYERMADEGWDNPLDWVHLNDRIMRQTLGFRPGHIQIFNRKFDLWVKKYNEVRRTISAKKKGKDGTLIVGKGERKVLKSNYNYEFTKVIVRQSGIITTKAWSPSFKCGGVLFITSHQEIVLERDAKITVSGKGCWGANTHKYRGWGQGAGGSCKLGSPHYPGPIGGAGGGGYGTPGGDGFRVKQDELSDPGHPAGGSKHQVSESQSSASGHHLGVVEERGGKKDATRFGDGGSIYPHDDDNRIHALDDTEDDFTSDGYATEKATDRFEKALGSGGGTYYAKTREDKKRGGTGGGAVRINCDKLIMYKGSKISASGFFDRGHDPLSSGGSGGSIRLYVKGVIKHIDHLNPKDRAFTLEAFGGGSQHMDLYKQRRCDGIDADDEKKTDESWMDKWAEFAHKEKMPPQIGIGGDGRIRIDFHSPYLLQLHRCKPRAVIAIGEASDNKDEKAKRTKSQAVLKY